MDYGITGSWAIIPFIHDVFAMEHVYARGIKYFGDLVNPGLYDQLKHKTIENVISRNIASNHLPWEYGYLSADIQERLLDFEMEINGSYSNLGQIYEQLYHDIINVIAPPNNEAEI